MTDATDEVLAQLRACERPLGRRALPGAPMRVRLETSPAIRRLLPGTVAVALATARAERAWRGSAELRERGLLAMEAIVGSTFRAAEAPELARRMVIEAAVRESLLWQPWLAPLIDEESSAHLRAAAESGRGVIASNCHIGPYIMVISIYRRFGRIPHILAGPWMFERQAPGAWGRRTVRWWEGARRGGARMVKTSGGAFATSRALLQAGEIVVNTFDMPGSRTTMFLGKPVDLASGTARLAVATDALVLPALVRREGRNTRVVYTPALDPRDFSDADALHDALADLHGAWILEEPEAMEDPRRGGVWEAGAGPERWSRPGAQTA